MGMLRSFATVSGLTMVSRVLGFIRDQAIAFTLGTSMIAEAFFVAQRFPNLFRALFAEGAFNNAFVPQFARRVEGDGHEEAHHFATQMFSVLFAWLVAFCSLAIIFMPWIMFLFTGELGGWIKSVVMGLPMPPALRSGEKFDLTVTLTRLCFPYLLFISLAALQAGVLNSLNRFTAAAAAPILLNLALIGSNLIAWYFQTGNTATTGYILAIGVSISGIAQYALLAWACAKAGMPLYPRWPKLTPAVVKVLKLSVPGLISGGVMQLNLFIATGIAYGISAVSFLYYADRLYQLPLGVIIVAIGVVLLPELSRRLRAGDDTGANHATNRALEISLFLTLPSAVALVIIPREIIQTVFEHGAFKHSDTQAVAAATAAFAYGLPAYALTKVFQPNFFAREDSKTPMRIAIISVVINIVASFTLSQFWGHVGIAFATTLAAWTNALLLGWLLLKRRYVHFDAGLRVRMPRIIAASVLMGGLLYGGKLWFVAAFQPGARFSSSATALTLLIIIGIVGYFISAITLRAVRLSELKTMLKR